MYGNDVTVLVLSSAALFLFITVFLGYFVVIYRNKQNINRKEQEKLQATFQFEILKTQLEVQENTFAYISKELHDNVNQVLSFIKLNLGLINSDDEVVSQQINESRDLIGETINDLRDLSQSLSFDRIMQLGLVKTISTSAERFNRSNVLNTSVTVQGDEYSLGEQRELVLFRIFQESVHNVLKHAAASQLTVNLNYCPDLFLLTIKDDGKGFLQMAKSEQQGAGLQNIINRAALIGAVAEITSTPGLGCTVAVSLNPLIKQSYADGSYSDSLSR